MKDFTVTARVPAKDGKPEKTGTVTVKVPENLKEAEKVYGADAILSNAIANWRVTLQSAIRSALKRGESQQAIQARLGDAKMGVAITKSSTRDPKAAWLAAYQAATPEERKRMKEELLKEAESL